MPVIFFHFSIEDGKIALKRKLDGGHIYKQIFSQIIRNCLSIMQEAKDVDAVFINRPFKM